MMSMLACVPLPSDDNIELGTLVFEMHPEIYCFQETHIMHAAFAIVVTIILLAINLLIVYLFFESRKCNNIFAK